MDTFGRLILGQLFCWLMFHIIKPDFWGGLGRVENMLKIAKQKPTNHEHTTSTTSMFHTCTVHRSPVSDILGASIEKRKNKRCSLWDSCKWLWMLFSFTKSRSTKKIPLIFQFLLYLEPTSQLPIYQVTEPLAPNI